MKIPIRVENLETLVSSSSEELKEKNRSRKMFAIIDGRLHFAPSHDSRSYKDWIKDTLDYDGEFLEGFKNDQGLFFNGEIEILRKHLKDLSREILLKRDLPIYIQSIPFGFVGDYL